MVELNQHYRTSDTPLAAYLKTKNYSLIFIDYEKPRFEFHFPDSEQIREDANNYITGNALTDPSDYSRVLRKLNRIIFKKCQWDED